MNLELGQITPPVGMNLFTIKAITRAKRVRRRGGGALRILLA
ncbi:MAG: hypothetical protein ABIX12_14855 [Rubrivivax sp.]